MDNKPTAPLNVALGFVEAGLQNREDVHNGLAGLEDVRLHIERLTAERDDLAGELEWRGAQFSVVIHERDDALTKLAEAQAEIDRLTNAGLEAAYGEATKADELEHWIATCDRLTAERDELRNHVWIDGPDGPGYHCSVCGISKCDDFDGYTCTDWLQVTVERLTAEYQARHDRLTAERDDLAGKLAAAHQELHDLRIRAGLGEKESS